MKVTVKSKNIFLQYYNNFKVYVNLTIVQFIVLPSFLSIYRLPFNSFLWIIPVCPSNPETFSRRRTIKSVCQEKKPTLPTPYDSGMPEQHLLENHATDTASGPDEECGDVFYAAREVFQQVMLKWPPADRNAFIIS